MEELNIEEQCNDPNRSVTMIIDSVRRFQTHELHKRRKVFSEYYHLFPVLKKYSDKFKNYTRMTVETFDYVMTEIEPHLQKNWCNFHKAIEPEERLVITLRLLASGASYNDLSFSFRIAESTVHKVVYEVMEVLWKEFCPVHMPIPNKDTFLNLAKDFYSIWDLPHCIGAIDGCHVRIKKPPKSGKLYYNYKKYFSIVLQGVVNAQYKFISIDVGGYCRQHDATTFRNSTFYEALRNGIITIPEDDKLPNSNITLPYFFVGDGAYPLREHLMKPYPGKELPEYKKVFNKRLSRGRVVVECAFGKLFQKWRIFYSTIQQLPKNVELIVKAACILHNIIIDLEGDSSEQPELLSGYKENDSECSTSTMNDDNVELAQQVRNQLAQYFVQHPLP